jgi:mRNA-degrading endonuclease RelE of RelBE toxin-antitoxin system
MKTDVQLTKKAEKQLKKAPKTIVVRFLAWVKVLSEQGLLESRKIKGFQG